MKESSNLSACPVRLNEGRYFRKYALVFLPERSNVMRRLLMVGAFASLCMAGLAVPTSARAVAIRPMPGPQQLAQADIVVVGKVLGIEDQDVAAAPFKGATNKVNYRIAVVKVSQQLKGDKTKGTIRVGFIPPGPVVQPRPGVIRPGVWRAGVQLTAGQEGLFYLNKHPTESFYLVNFGGFTSNQNKAAFDQQLKTAQQAAKLLADPISGLKSENAKDRLLTASLLLTKYRTARGGPVKTEPIDAKESKLILKAILDADWTPKPIRFGDPTPNPQQLFYQLGATVKDGWQPPQPKRVITPGQPPRFIFDPQAVPNAMRTWLREHLDTFRIQRFVPADKSASR
jgi:hypothetical protein